MEQTKTNLVLIGMPGSGKSTVGVLLAKRLKKRFIDIDLMIQSGEGKSLSRLIEQYGMRRFCEIESDYAQRVDVENAVIATGGSVVYYEEAMASLSQIGRIVYLKLPLEEISQRLGDLQARGVVLEPGQTLAQLYEKRTPLYEKWAQVTADLAGLKHDACVDTIINLIKNL